MHTPCGTSKDLANSHLQREARALLALADGLTTHVLIGHLTPQEAHDVLHAHLAGLWERRVRPPH